jgi:hypothetical protein
VAKFPDFNFRGIRRYSKFEKELKKKKIKLIPFQEGEWGDYFLGEQEKAVMLKTQIDTTDKDKPYCL